MYKKVRKKVAESLSKVDSPEHYDWNKWLREPTAEDYYIEPLFTGLIDTSNIVISTTIPSFKGYTFDLPKIKISKAFKQLNVQKQKTNKIFFSFPNTILNSVKEILSESNVIFSLSVRKSDKGSFIRIINGQNKEITETVTELSSYSINLSSPGTFKYPLLLPGEKVYTREVNLNVKTEVYDLLSNLKTEVINVKLLNSDNFVDPIKFSESRQVEFQPLAKTGSIKKIDVVNFENLIHSIQEQKKLIQKIIFPVLSSEHIPAVSEIILPNAVKNMLKIMSVKNIKIPQVKVKSATKFDHKTLPVSESFSFKRKNNEAIKGTRNDLLADLEMILQPVIKFGKEEKDKLYNFLYDYEKPAADYLSDNKLVLLNDELGAGKTLEVIGALKILFHKKDISEAIIICNNFETGWKNRNPDVGEENLSGWYDHFNNYFQGIKADIIAENSEGTWKKPSAIKIMSYKIFSEAVEKNLLSLNDLNRRSCVIIDDIEEFPDIKFDVLPKYFWLISSLPLNEIKPKISDLTGSENEIVNFGRTKKELTESIPKYIKQDYWIEMEPEQKAEYEKALESGREKIYDLVQAGNPFLVQSNVFTLIHQLTQIGNFYGNKEDSAKSELLLRHIKTIQKNGQKVLVFTQYDRQGTQRLEKLFSQNGIKYVIYQTGISLKEMEEAVKKFSKNKSITVFLAGMKAINSKINLTGIPYLIHFDQWWSPVTTWQAEERINADENSLDSLNVYNYLIRGSVEEKIKVKLTEKGLLNRKLFDLLNSEMYYSLISNEDWLEILDLIEPKDEATLKSQKESNDQYVLNLSTEDFAHKIKAFIGRIGYKNVSFKTSHNPDEVRLYAAAIKNSTEVKAAIQCLNMKTVTKKVVKDFIESLVTGTDKILIFTKGEFDKKLRKTFDDERIEFIDKHQISDYLSLFGLL